MKKLTRILLVEDDQVDMMTVQRALKKLEVEHELIHTVDGEEALEFLHDPANDLPQLILFDLNMPRMNGLEFLEELQADERLKSIPSIALTTSTCDSDRLSCLQMGAAEFIAKSVNYSDFVESMKVVHKLLHIIHQSETNIS